MKIFEGIFIAFIYNYVYLLLKIRVFMQTSLEYQSHVDIVKDLNLGMIPKTVTKLHLIS